MKESLEGYCLEDLRSYQSDIKGLGTLKNI